MKKQRRRLGRSLRQRREQEARLARYAIPTIRNLYAQFCARGAVQYAQRYDEALEDFVKLVSIRGVAQIAVNPEATSLFIGTECIEQHDFGGKLRVLGHFIVTITRDPPGYAIENLTPSGEYAHPHARQGDEFCMSDGKHEIKIAIIDGVISAAMNVIMTALWMERGTVTISTPLRAFATWPLKES